MKKICVITSSRADYGLLKHLLIENTQYEWLIVKMRTENNLPEFKPVRVRSNIVREINRAIERI